MENTAKEIEPELSPELEKWLHDEVVPIAKDVQSGKRRGMPLMEAYKLTMKDLAEHRNTPKK